jgi:4-hydroxyphenylacetate 3-monooxygenase
MLRRGDDYVASLKDGRTVYLDGERVKDVTTHPAFSRQIRTVAELYEQSRHLADQGRLVIEDPELGESYSAMWLIPRSIEDLRRRREVHTFWAEGTYGLMGRSPDHVASVLTGFAASPHVFERGGKEFAENVVRFHEKCVREDPYCAYVIVPPQVDRSKPAHQQPEPFLYAGVAKEKDDGIVLRGAQMIGTAAIFSDYVFLSYIVPLAPGDEDYAISCMVPTDAQGLKIYPRRPYSDAATSVYDYPLSSQFDEIDSMIVFDDVFVPWEHVFVYRDIDLINAQFHETGSHVIANFQSLVRFVTKLHFTAGLARRLAALHALDSLPPVQALLGGQIAAVCAAIEAVTRSAENEALIVNGTAWPRPQYIYAGMSLQRRLVVDLMRYMRELAGGAFIAVPSSERSFLSAETEADTKRYFQSVGASAEERVKVLRLIWDFVGTEMAGRQLQYEMFYSAPQHVVDVRLFKHYDWDRGLELVEKCLGSYKLGQES